ncbi:PTS sugar transporter [Lactobacillus amylovorus DSM 20531]|jgi:mannose/fructose/N-acetylgalactosamine-specific phosphotransferase system component IIC|uniref:PTS mannose/fructose/sorbose/N-acetylgalactosamine transporter subunit IIC n=1 Tax=Lactobacillus TaxID=1578 RepID=UPI0006EF9D0B|nr:MULTISPECIES: PTS sugar transporter subunit IIC [Lactobacillus]ATO53425.1 PTS sugar transporter [Lactobacillus amylovorus DSM 20531]KRK42562.1 phosphotransferase system PTS, sorbose-specific IIC subunit [Lactobacillus amylovorus DSM 20531]MCT3592887.1 PTS sugar transporter subunit IIC [Lactobacillus amylovorus]PEH05931.1 PTS sugar transporter subunit IIC [Lactobacillus sp. UMNPBX4]
MLEKALIVAIAYYLIYYINQSIGLWQFNRPIIVGPIIGLLLGDLRTGIILGGTFESVFLGVIAVGGAIPADALVGSTIGTATAILTGASNAKALAIAVPVAALAIITLQITYSYMALFLPKLDNYAKKGDEKGITRWHIGMGFMTPALNTIAIFFALYLGTDAIKEFLAVLPKFVSQGFIAAGKMLPAVGFAMLLNMLFKKKYFIWFFVGFALVVYLKLPNLAVALFATAIAFLMYDVASKSISKNVEDTSQSGKTSKSESKEQEEEDFLS